MQRDGRVSTRVVVRAHAHARACVRELVTREAQRSPRTYVCTYVRGGWLSSYNGYASGEAGSIHSCSARTSGLPFTISHLPFTILLGWPCFNLSLDLPLFFSFLHELEREREKEKARNEHAALRDNVRLAVLHRMQMVSGLEWLESRPLAASEQVHLVVEEIDLLYSMRRKEISKEMAR